MDNGRGPPSLASDSLGVHVASMSACTAMVVVLYNQFGQVKSSRDNQQTLYILIVKVNNCSFICNRKGVQSNNVKKQEEQIFSWLSAIPGYRDSKIPRAIFFNPTGTIHRLVNLDEQNLLQKETKPRTRTPSSFLSRERRRRVVLSTSKRLSSNNHKQQNKHDELVKLWYYLVS
eukprot:scaffold5771_cov171-Amphora_coffeaeformis.AAC.23